MKALLMAFIFVVTQFSFISVYSQDNWFAEFKPNLNFPLNDEEIKTGYGFNLALGYNLMPHLDAYVGWGWNQFKADDNFFIENQRYDLEETGYTFGLQFIHPFNNNPDISYVIKLGGIYNHIEIENSEGNLIADSGHGLGWDVGAGFVLHFNNNWNLSPQIGYRSLTREIKLDSDPENFDLNYLSIAIAIAKRF